MIIIKPHELESFEDKMPDRQSSLIFDRIKEITKRMVVTRDKPALSFICPRLMMHSCEYSDANVGYKYYAV